MTATSLIPKAAKAIGYSFETLIEKIVQDALK
jgi:D-alanine-D-alanine ligase-like ATP-grasp enzyme